MIGIFDSGSGGLTVLHAIRRRLPSSDVVYFGDTAHAPYGSRSRAELTRLTVAGFELLAARGATSIVSACNSVSASLALSLLDTLPVSPERIVEMVGPTVAAFGGSTARAALFATQATVDSRLYQDGFDMMGMEIRALAIPDLAGAIESGAPRADLERIVSQAVSGADWQSLDTCILACTHFPLISDIFRAHLPPHVTLFDPAEAVAARVEERFWPREAGYGVTKFVISAESASFRANVARLFPDTQYEVEVLQ